MSIRYAVPPREVSAYARVQAIVRARYSTLLDETTWAGLVECRDLAALIGLLSRTVYSAHLQIPSEQLTARRIVYQLHWRLAHDYDKLIEVVPEPRCALIVNLSRLHEVDNLKAALRGVETGASWDHVRHLLSPVAGGTTLEMVDFQSMVQSGSVAGAIERTAGTPYYDTLIHALERYRTEHNLFPLEVALDLEHRRALWGSVQSLGGRDRREALRLVGTMIDNDNLLWALRYRVHHRLSEQEIINYTLPFGYEVRDEDIRGVAAGRDMRQIVLGMYPELADSEQFGDLETGGLARLEHFLLEQLMETCRSVFSGDPFHIGLPIAYLTLRENEIRNLTTVIEAKASQLPPAVFEPLLVR